MLGVAVLLKNGEFYKVRVVQRFTLFVLSHEGECKLGVLQVENFIISFDVLVEFSC